MALPVTVLSLGREGGDALIAEWYQPDGATVRKGELVYRLETDFAAVEVEAEEDGVLQHRAEAGTRQPPGHVVAMIVAVGAEPAVDALAAGLPEPVLPKPKPRGDRRGSYPLAEVLRAAAEEVSASSASPAVEDLPWEAPASAATPAEETSHAAPLLLFPRIVHELKEQAEMEALEEELEPEPDALEMAAEPEPPTRMRAGAWDLVPGENDFNPDWIMERNDREEPPPGRGRRFQASNIRSLALGREEAPPSEAIADATPGSATVEPLSPTLEEEPRPPAPLETEPKAAPRKPGASPTPLAVESNAAPAAIDLFPGERRADYVPGPTLFLRVGVDAGEAAKMRDQLTREWWGSNVRPTDEDIVLRAIARALHESAAFRRRTDVVGMRPLTGNARTVHLLGDAATRPFRDAVASLASLRETAGADVQCMCTLTSFAELDLDEATPALPNGQPLAFAMGAVRDVARYRGDKPYRAQVMMLTLAYDSDAMPDGAAARLLSRVRELVEAPYALLAD